MESALLPVPVSATPLGELSLAAAPDLLTAVAAGEAHGLAPSEALKAAFGKWLTEHAESVERYGLASFYEGHDASRAFVNQTRLLQFVTVMLAEQGREIASMRRDLSGRRGPAMTRLGEGSQETP